MSSVFRFMPAIVPPPPPGDCPPFDGFPSPMRENRRRGGEPDMADDTRTLSEVLAEAAQRDGYKVEWYAGKIVIQTSASAYHNLIITETLRQIPPDQWWALPDMGV